MPLDWSILFFVAGVVLGLAGRPIVVRCFRAVMGLKRQVDDIKRDAER